MTRLKIAAIVTEYRKYSHAQHIVDRFLYGYGWDGRHHRPPMDVVSLYADQVPEDDMSRSRTKESPSLQIYPTVAEALTLGGEKLVVNGVLLIGEHGEYPTNEKGQRLYPRYEFLQQVVDVFGQDGRAVPVFNDKHLSYNFDKARKMVAASKQLGFPLVAGSSLPITYRVPSVEIPLHCTVEDALMVG